MRSADTARHRLLRMLNLCCSLFLREDKRRSTCKTLVFGFTLIFILHWLVKFEQIREHGDFADLSIPISDDFVPLGIKEMETFPVSGQPRFPKIIHQTWRDTQIPRKFEKWVRTWQRNHPGWTYILWTDESARQLISDKYPSFLPVFDSYSEGIRRADALRYFILYEYGGVYADMDLESLKPLNPITFKYSCILAQEPYEHSILDSNFEHLIINAFIACRKGHPFLKMVIDYLPSFSHMWNVLDSTGPHFMTFAYRQFLSAHHYPDNHMDGTYLAPAEYFFPSIDPAKHFWMRQQCVNFDKISTLQKKACMHLKLKGVERSDKYAFTTHHWIHTYLNFKLSLKGPVDIHVLVPGAQIYPHITLAH
ncbi:inositol phosphoceramide mannosyltransferase 2-like isoform X2 [Haliotis rufescens]|uniref:inositol phosphoceramide mannosyltransferase 2-like isoform X2 n=1 Tax=Haliotis rufescens TaxID=6454 RepID=UPI001EAFB439|nr:inositol phosphoceramide mannosyltransferase 2-like isoform X2 [Haliotis rufescens]